jgi:hypothetical protein
VFLILLYFTILRSFKLLLSNMPRRSTIYHREPKEWFLCPVRGCSWKLRTQAGRTKHIRAKHNKNNELQPPSQAQAESSLSVLKIPQLPQAPVSDRQDSDSDAQADSSMPDVPRTPHLASNFGFQDGLGMNMARSPIPSNNDPTSPLPFNDFEPEIENHHDQAEQVFVSSTNYHPFINGMT